MTAINYHQILANVCEAAQCEGATDGVTVTLEERKVLQSLRDAIDDKLETGRW